MDIDIDGILINIEGSSTDAESSIDRTINTLKELRNAASSAGTGLNTLKVRFDALGNIKGVTATLKAASEEAKKQKADYSSLADEISNISKRFASLTPEARKAATQAAKAADALRSLSGKKYSPDASSAASMLKDLSSSMSGMVSTKSQIDAVSTAFSKLPPNIRKVITANSQLETSNTKTSKSFALYAAKATIIVATLRSVAHVISNFIKESNDYVENLNLFTVAMGEYADQSQKYAETVGDVMGIDPSDWMRNQGVFMTLATGFGVVSDRAEIMSRNLTQLGYDLSSFFNISVEDAMQKLQSGISGELEPLRRLGYDLSQARLEAVALSLGIDQSVTSMNQAQKAQLRYYAIMTQVTTAQGDMARTLEAPANQLRIFQAQLTQAARAIGNIFIPALNAVLPYAIAFIKVIRWIATEIANLFGFSLPEVDYSGISSVGSSFDDVADAADGATSAAKELKGTLAGFDEINLIAQETGGGGSGSGGSSTGGDFGFELPQYDFLGDVVDSNASKIFDKWKSKLEPFVTWLKDNFDEILDLAIVIGTTILGWKVGKGLINFLDSFSLLSNKSSLLSGLFGGALTLGGGASMFLGIKDALQEGLDGLNLAEIIGGGASVTGGAAMIGKALGNTILGGAIGAIGAGIPGFIVGIYDAITDGLDIFNAILIPVSSTLAGAGIGALIGSIGGPLGALIGFAVGLLTDLIIYVVQNWEEVVAWAENAWNKVKEIWGTVSEWFSSNVIQPVVSFFIGLWEDISGFFVGIWDGIKEIWSGVASWFNDNVIQPVVDTFSPIVEWISTFFEGCWMIVRAVWQVASTWFNENVIQPVVSFFKKLYDDVSSYFSELWDDIKIIWEFVSTWFNSNVIQPVVSFFKALYDDVSEFFSSLWDGIKSIWDSVAGWFNSNVIQPVVGFFKDAIDSIGKFFDGLWTSIKNGIVSAMNSVISGIESALNWIVDGLNGFISGFNSVVQWAANILGEDWKGLGYIGRVSLGRIQVYASGGFPEMGDLFIANDAGPEFVGTINGRTAVANNDQIVEGIALGVASAQEEQNALLREQNSLLRQLLSKEGTVVFPTSVEAGRAVQRALNMYNIARGVT